MTKIVTPVSTGFVNTYITESANHESGRLHSITSETFRSLEKSNGSRDQPGHETFLYRDLLKRDFTPSPWLFDGLMRSNEVAMIYAATGVGKTWMTLSLAMIAAGGGKVLDWSNDTPRKVLYLDGEMDGAELIGRMKSLEVGLGCDPEALRNNFVLCPRQMQRKVDGGFIEIEDENSQLGIIQYAAENNVGLVVIDNLTTLSGQLDENASKDMKGFNTFLLRAKQRGLAVLVVHHQGKGRDSGPRGSTAMVATLNLMLKLEASSQERAAGDTDAKFTVVFEKNRGQIDNRPLPVKVTRATFGTVIGIKSGEVLQQDVVLVHDEDADSNGHRVKKLLQTGKYRNQSELAAAYGGTQSTISKIIKQAIAQGIMSDTYAGECFKRARSADTVIIDSESEAGHMAVSTDF